MLTMASVQVVTFTQGTFLSDHNVPVSRAADHRPTYHWRNSLEGHRLEIWQGEWSQLDRTCLMGPINFSF